MSIGASRRRCATWRTAANDSGSRPRGCHTLGAGLFDASTTGHETMTEQIIDHDTDTDTRFDPSEWRERLRAESKINPSGNGYMAVVVDRGPPGDRNRVPVVEFNSRAEHASAGVFNEHLRAVEYAQRWLDARVAQLAREHLLRVRRGIGLSTRLRRLGRELAYLDDEAKAIGRRKKENEASQARLIREANDPKVEIDLLPTSSAWRLFDAPTETDGTLDQSRQLVLEHTGLDPIVPSEVEAPRGDPGLQLPTEAVAHDLTPANDEGRKLPPSVLGRDGKAIKPGQWVEVLSGVTDTVVAAGFMVSIDATLNGDHYSVTVLRYETDGEIVEQSAPTSVANHQIRRASKPKGLKCPKWPEPVEESGGEATTRADESDLGAVLEVAHTWPSGVTDKRGRALRMGSWVRTDDEVPVALKLLRAVVDPAGGFALTGVTADGVEYLANTAEVSRSVKPKDYAQDAPAPPVDEEVEVDEVDQPIGLDPSDTVWPEDEEGVDL